MIQRKFLQAQMEKERRQQMDIERWQDHEGEASRRSNFPTEQARVKVVLQ